MFRCLRKTYFRKLSIFRNMSVFRNFPDVCKMLDSRTISYVRKFLDPNSVTFAIFAKIIFACKSSDFRNKYYFREIHTNTKFRELSEFRKTHVTCSKSNLKFLHKEPLITFETSPSHPEDSQRSTNNIEKWHTVKNIYRRLLRATIAILGLFINSL